MHRNDGRRARRRARGFTLVELLTVIAVIAVLAGMVLATQGPVWRMAARAKTNSEVHAMEAALGRYRQDNGTYPQHAVLDFASADNTAEYGEAARVLYRELTGDTSGGGAGETAGEGVTPTRYYDQFSKQSVTAKVAQDPFGNPYGYSTRGSYNPTFDLWSTGGDARKRSDESMEAFQKRWLKNW